MSLKSLFTKACNYARYCHDVVSIIPTEKVKEGLKAEGWKFKPSAQATVILESAGMPYSAGNGLPLEVVTTETGANVYLGAGEDKADLQHETINRYEAAKKRIAKTVYGI